MTTTRTPQPLNTGPQARRYAPGSWQIPTIGSSRLGQPPTVVTVALVRGDVVTATSTSLPAVAFGVPEQPLPLVSVLLASVSCTATQRRAAHATLVAA